MNFMRAAQNRGGDYTLRDSRGSEDLKWAKVSTIFEHRRTEMVPHISTAIPSPLNILRIQ
jgi:hypothetical protein